MIGSINIQGLRGIKSGRVDDLTGLNVLVGPNGSGKSTILDALLIGAASNIGDAVGRAVRRRDAFLTPRWLLWRTGQEETTEIVATESTGDRRVCSIWRASGGDPDAAETLGWKVDYRGTESEGTTRFGEKNTYDYDRAFRPLESVSEVRVVDSQLMRMGSEPLHQLYSQAVNLGRRRNAKEMLRGLMDNLDDIEITTERDQPVVTLVYPDLGVPVAVSGDGVHFLTRICLELASRSSGLSLVEEPEAHLHPAAIDQVAKVFWEAVRRGIQIVATSHSLELIDAIVSNAKDDRELGQFALFRNRLNDGKLLVVRHSGTDVAGARAQVAEDLR